MRLTHDFIVQATGARCLNHPEKVFRSIGSDTRKSLNELLFVALKGDQFDGHDYLEKAIQAGAYGVLIHDEFKATSKIMEQAAVYVVPNTLRALQALAKAYRKKMKAKVIAITGSNGKTTTKEFTAQILSESFCTHYNVGSFNNHWGVPFSLMDLSEEHRMAVIEMGMNHSGEIAELVRIANPDVVVCTMVGRAHIENFPEGMRGVATAKEEIYLTAKDEATRIFNIDQDETREMYHRSRSIYPRSKILTFSQFDEKADVYLKIKKVDFTELSLSGKINGQSLQFTIPVFGSHNITNVLAAVSVAVSVGMTNDNIILGLSKLKTTWGRNQFVKLASGAQVIFDGYNANPDSMAALLENSKLIKVAGKKIGVFGQMRELGDTSAQLHRELGTQVAYTGFDMLFFIGEDHEAFKQGVESTGYKNALIVGSEYSRELGKQLGDAIQKEDAVFMKASRGTQIEIFFEFLDPVDFKSKK